MAINWQAQILSHIGCRLDGEARQQVSCIFLKKNIKKGSKLPLLCPKEFLQLAHRQLMEHPTPLFLRQNNIKLNKAHSGQQTNQAGLSQQNKWQVNWYLKALAVFFKARRLPAIAASFMSSRSRSIVRVIL